MDTAQVWTMIGAFSAVMFGGFGLMARVIKAEIGGVRAEIGGLRSEMNARFTDVDHRLEALETDMHLIKGHLIGQQSA